MSYLDQLMGRPWSQGSPGRVSPYVNVFATLLQDIQQFKQDFPRPGAPDGTRTQQRPQFSAPQMADREYRRPQAPQASTNRSVF